MMILGWLSSQYICWVSNRITGFPTLKAMGVAELYRWLQGSLMWAKLDTLLVSLPIVLAGIFCLYHTRRYLDLLTFGEETASTMGVDPKRSFFIAPLA